MYRALLSTGKLKKRWADMEYLLSLEGEAKLLDGSTPPSWKEIVQCAKTVLDKRTFLNTSKFQKLVQNYATHCSIETFRDLQSHIIEYLKHNGRNSPDAVLHHDDLWRAREKVAAIFRNEEPTKRNLRIEPVPNPSTQTRSCRSFMIWQSERISVSISTSQLFVTLVSNLRKVLK
jgi:hypothetical protein